MSSTRWGLAGAITLLLACPDSLLAAGARGRWVALPEVTDSPLRHGEDVSVAARSGDLDVILPFPLTIDGRSFGRMKVGAGFIELMPAALPTASLDGVTAAGDRGTSLRIDVVAGDDVSLSASAITVMSSSSEAVVVRYAGLVVAGSSVVAEIALRPPGDIVLQYLHVPLAAQQAAAQGRVHAGDALTSILPASATAFRLRQPDAHPILELPKPSPDPLPIPQAPPPFPANCTAQPGTWCDLTGGGAQIWLNEGFDDGLALTRGWTATDQWHQVDFATCAPGASANPGKSFYYGNDATCTYQSAGGPPPRRNGSLKTPFFGPVTANGQFVFSSRAQYEFNPNGPPDFDLAQIYVNGTLLGNMPETLDPTQWFNFNPIPLAPWAGLNAQIEFYFEADDTISFLGWFVDDVIAWDAGAGTVDCIINAGHQTWTGCDVRNSDVWHFNENSFCAGCTYSFYVLVECGRQMHLPLDDMEGAEVRVTNMVTGLPPTLRCVNRTALADAGNGPYPGFTIPSATPGINLDCGAPAGEDVFWGPAFDATNNAGLGAVSWGFNRNCPDILVYDRDADGVECSELPNDGGLLPNISPGEIQTMDCYIEDSVGLCGLYRVDVTSGGFDWFLFANCDGTNTPQFPIYHDCQEAWTAFNPLPELALANLTASNTCPATLDVTFDLINLGCTDQIADVVVELRSNCVPEDVTFVTVPGPILANTSVPVQAQFTVTCQPVRIEAIVDPGNIVTECTEAANAASCNAEPGVDFLATFTCGCSAQLDPDAGNDKAACAGSMVTLDGSRSTGAGCATRLLYRWLDAGGSELAPQSALPTLDVPLSGCPGPTTFTLEIQCEGEVCTATDAVTISCLDPVAVAGQDVVGCADGQVVLDGSGSSVAGCAQVEYRWLDPSGAEARTWSQNPLFSIPALDCADAGDYTVEVRCTTGGSCFASDVVNVGCTEVLANGGPDLPTCEDAPVLIQGNATSQGCASVLYGWFINAPGGPIPLTNPAFGADPTLDAGLGVPDCPAVVPLLFVAFCDADGDTVLDATECGTIDEVTLDCTKPDDPVPVATVDCAGATLSCGTPVAGLDYTWDLDILADADADTVPDNDPQRGTCDVAATPFPAGDTTARVTATDANGCTAFADVVVTAPVPWTPVEVGGERLSHQGTAVGFTWPPAPGRASYKLVRGDLDRTPRSLWVMRAHEHAADDTIGRGACTVLTESYTDPDDGLTGVNYYYLIIAVGPCGEEGPTGDQWDTVTFFPRPGRTPTASCP